jgi:hypothetical protein
MEMDLVIASTKISSILDELVPCSVLEHGTRPFWVELNHRYHGPAKSVVTALFGSVYVRKLMHLI